MTQKTMIQTITDTLTFKLENDENVVVSGEDIGENGGVSRATEGLQERFGENQIFDTPLTGSGIAGSSFGFALEGSRPVPEIQFFGSIFEATDEAVAQVAHARYRTSGTKNLPIAIRSSFGGGVYTPELHSDSLEGLIAQPPGIWVVVPSSPYDAKGLLISSIRSNNPVVFLEHMKLYRSFREEVPDETYEVPLGKAVATRERTDVSIITYGAMVREAIKTADNLAKENISVGIIDLRAVAPLDVKTIIQPVEKAGRVAIVQEVQRQTGAAAQVVSEIPERAILSLEAPVGRVSAPSTVLPFGQVESVWLPNTKDIKNKVEEITEF